jgi:hypothetical protein
MRILSLSHNPLPDSRVEKAAYTAKKDGHLVFFAGPEAKGFGFPVKTFKKTYSVPFQRKANLKIPPYWNLLKKSLKKVIQECKPDLIHAHNIIAGKLACESKIPFIYDDHEYWPMSLKARGKKKLYHILSHPYRRWLIKRWENEFLEKASAVITTSKTVAEERRRYNSNVFVVPNFPSLVESQAIEINKVETRHLSSVYLGKDCSQPEPYRNVTGLTELFKQNEIGTLTVIGDNQLATNPPIISLGFLFHQEMMKEMTKHHVGLLPWKKHWVHKFSNPNKPYEYAHAGLLILSTSDIKCVLSNIKDKEIIKAFDDYGGLLELLTYYKNSVGELIGMKTKIRNYALKNLIWEKNESKILQSYSSS